MAEFTCFSLLPTEIRHIIWDMAASVAIEPQVIEMVVHTAMTPTGRPYNHKFHSFRVAGKVSTIMEENHLDDIHPGNPSVVPDGYPAILYGNRESRERALLILTFMKHPAIPTSGFYMMPESDVFFLDGGDSYSLIGDSVFNYYGEQLTNVRIVIVPGDDWEHLLRSMASDDKEDNLSAIVGRFTKLRLMIVMLNRSCYGEDDVPHQIVECKPCSQDEARMINEQWWDRPFDIEVQDYDGNVYGRLKRNI